MRAGKARSADLSGRRASLLLDARMLTRPSRGIPTYVTRLCRLLPELRPAWDFHLAINPASVHDAPETEWRPALRELASRQNVHVTEIACEREAIWEQWHLRRLARRLRPSLLFMPANRAMALPPTRLVVGVADVMEKVFLRELVPMPPLRDARRWQYQQRTRAYRRYMYDTLIPRADAIITVSEYSAADIARHLRVPPARITAIHLGVDEVFRLSPGDAARASLRERRGVLMLGGDSHQKNPRAAILAWRALPPPLRRAHPLCIAGFAGGSDSPIVQTLREIGEADVHLVGWLGQAELVRRFREAAVFLYLSRYEGFGLPPLQAMASATPVLHSDAACLPEIAGGAGIAVAPEDVEGATRALERLLSDPELWASRSREGYARSERFSWLECARRHLDVFERVLARGDGSR